MSNSVNRDTFFQHKDDKKTSALESEKHHEDVMVFLAQSKDALSYFEKTLTNINENIASNSKIKPDEKKIENNALIAKNLVLAHAGTTNIQKTVIEEAKEAVVAQK